MKNLNLNSKHGMEDNLYRSVGFKTRTIIILLMIILISILIIIKPGENISGINRHKNIFQDSTPYLTGAYCSGDETNRSLLRDSLNFNLWHTYLSYRKYNEYYITQGWRGAGSMDSLYYPDSNAYIPLVKSILDSNEQFGIKTLMQRPKTEWLFYAQRSDYQCEETVENPEYNWFYTYKSHPRGIDYTDTSRYGNGIKVRYCRSGEEDSGYVVMNLRCNREQINTGNPGHGYPYPGFGDKQFSWYIKPRIRIDSVFANDTSNFLKKVIRIEVINYEDSVIKIQDVKVINFKEGLLLPYSGKYIEEFYTILNDTVSLTIPEGKYFNPNNRDWTDRNSNCGVDFRVFWYGNCDMWIDYVRLDDKRANDLFGDTISNFYSQTYHNMIQMEVRHSKLNSSPVMFFIDEFEYNHIPAITYVMKKLRQYSGGSDERFTLATSSTYQYWYQLHLPADTSLDIEHFSKYCIDSIKLRAYMAGSYPFRKPKYPNINYQTRIPNTLPQINQQYAYAHIVNPDQYEEWLQDYLEIQNPLSEGSGQFITECKNIREISDTRNLLVLFALQTHAHNFEDYLREPTNEEIRMMVNTVISYGMGGIMYYWYGAFGQDNQGGIIDENNFSVGIANKLGENANLTPRYTNFYGQQKFAEICRINTILRKWSPYLKSFNNVSTNSYIYRNSEERTNFLNNTYINGIETYGPSHSNPDNPGDRDPVYLTYIQAGVFKNSEENKNYFMIVNRRCSPYDFDNNENGGRRYVKIFFDSSSSSFSDFNNWKITDLYNDSTVGVFDKRNYS
ncbi:MAG: hypothetical protein FJ216_10295, partial [Ignavibacteria bacterium]|nr:hypothetical protein [Ignavibacteria bacterium]